MVTGNSVRANDNDKNKKIQPKSEQLYDVMLYILTGFIQHGTQHEKKTECSNKKVAYNVNEKGQTQKQSNLNKCVKNKLKMV